MHEICSAHTHTHITWMVLRLPQAISNRNCVLIKNVHQKCWRSSQKKPSSSPSFSGFLGKRASDCSASRLLAYQWPSNGIFKRCTTPRVVMVPSHGSASAEPFYRWLCVTLVVCGQLRISWKSILLLLLRSSVGSPFWKRRTFLGFILAFPHFKLFKVSQ